MKRRDRLFGAIYKGLPPGAYTLTATPAGGGQALHFTLRKPPPPSHSDSRWAKPE